MKHPLITLTTLILAGSFLGIVASYQITLTVILSILFISLLSIKNNRKTVVTLIVLTITLSALSAGFVNIKSKSMLYNRTNVSSVIEGKIVDKTIVDNHINIIVKTTKIGGQNINLKLISSIYGDNESINMHDTVSITGNISEFEGSRYWGDFSQRNRFLAQGISGVCSIDDITVNKVNKNFIHPNMIGYFIREHIKNNINTNFTGETAALLKAIIIGDTSSFTFDMKDSFARSGLSHITAVSGMNVSMFVSLFSAIVLLLAPKRRGYIISIIMLVLLYIVSIGARPSILRAGGMMIYAMIMLGRKQRIDTLCSLLFVSGVMVIFNPFYTVDISFQLSFMATLGIVLFANKITHLIGKENFGSVAVAVSLSANILIIPIMAYYYNTVSGTFLFSNLIALPLIGLITPLGYLSGVFGILIAPSAFIANSILWISKYFAGADFMQIPVASPSIFIFIIYYTAVILIYQRKNLRVFYFCTSILMITAIASTSFAMMNGNKLIVDRTQSSVFIRTTDRHYVLIGDGYDIEAYSKKKNISKIDLAVVTYYNKDSAEKVIKLLESNKIHHLLLPEGQKGNSWEKKILKNAENIPVTYFNLSGDVVNIGNTKIRLPFGQVI